MKFWTPAEIQVFDGIKLVGRNLAFNFRLVRKPFQHISTRRASWQRSTIWQLAGDGFVRLHADIIFDDLVGGAAQNLRTDNRKRRTTDRENRHHEHLPAKLRQIFGQLLDRAFEVFGFFAGAHTTAHWTAHLHWLAFFHALLSHYAAPFAVVADIFCRSSSESWEAAIS